MKHSNQAPLPPDLQKVREEVEKLLELLNNPLTNSIHWNQMVANEIKAISSHPFSMIRYEKAEGGLRDSNFYGADKKPVPYHTFPPFNKPSGL